MNWKKRLLTYAILAAVAVIIVLVIAGFESGQETGASVAAQLRFASNGCFTVAVLYIGCSILMAVQEAGNFYGIQFLFHTLARRFSPRKASREERKSYYLYCQEKKERQAAEGKSPVKSAMFLVGLVCLLLSIGLAALFYRQM